jgi:hypothetical protein
MNKQDIILQQSEKFFSAEEARTQQLDEKAEKVIAAIVVVVGFHLVDINRLAFAGRPEVVLSSWIAAFALIILGAAIVFALVSRRVQAYVSYPRGLKLIDDLRDQAIDEEGSKLLIARMNLCAHDCNAQLNDTRAKLLSISGTMLVAGFLLAVASIAIVKIAK